VVAAAATGYPVVIKARGLAGSIGVIRAAGPAAVAAAFVAAISVTFPGGPVGVLVEEYLPGPEISVDCVVADGACTITALACKQTGLDPFFEETGHTVHARDRCWTTPCCGTRWVAGMRFLYSPEDCEVISAAVRHNRLAPGGHRAVAIAAPGTRLALPPRGYISRYAYVIAVGDDLAQVDAARRPGQPVRAAVPPAARLTRRAAALDLREPGSERDRSTDGSTVSAGLRRMPRQGARHSRGGTQSTHPCVLASATICCRASVIWPAVSDGTASMSASVTSALSSLPDRTSHVSASRSAGLG
jgi:hypothetical protein